MIIWNQLEKIQQPTIANWDTTDGKLMNLNIDLFSIQNWHNFIPVVCVHVRSVLHTFVFHRVHVAWLYVLVCCVETGSVQTQFPLYCTWNVPAATAIKVVNNPSLQLRQGPGKKPTQRQCQRTRSGVCSSNMDDTSLTQRSLRFQLAFRAAGWLNLLQTNNINAEDVLKWQVKNDGGQSGDKAKSQCLCYISYFIVLHVLRSFSRCHSTFYRFIYLIFFVENIFLLPLPLKSCLYIMVCIPSETFFQVIWQSITCLFWVFTKMCQTFFVSWICFFNPLICHSILKLFDAETQEHQLLLYSCRLAALPHRDQTEMPCWEWAFPLSCLPDSIKCC